MDILNQMHNTVLTADESAVWYLGQETFLIKTQGKYLLFDPYLSDYVDRVCSDNEITWSRRYPAPVDARDLEFVDYVFISHDHEDHCDPDTLMPFASSNKKAKFIAPPEAARTLNKCGISDERKIFAYAGRDICLDGKIKVTPIPAAHEVLHKDSEGNYKELGYYVSVSGTTFFHSGDMCPYEDINRYIKKADVAMIAINGRDEYRLAHGIEGNFNSSEAIELALRMDADMLIPMHFDLYEVNSVPMGEFANIMEKQKKFIPFHVFIPGERYIYKNDRLK